MAYASFTADPFPYSGQAPDYVRGAVWTAPRAPPPPEVEAPQLSQTHVFAYYEEAAPPPEEAWTPPPTYPSLDGDILAGTEAAPPPAIEVASPEA